MSSPKFSADQILPPQETAVLWGEQGMHGDEGFVALGALVALAKSRVGALIVGVAAASLFMPGILKANLSVDEEVQAQDSHIVATSIHLQPEEFTCRTSRVVDVAGTEMQTALVLGFFGKNMLVPGTQHGAKMETGKVALTTCGEELDQTFTEGEAVESGGKQVRTVAVKVNVDSLMYSSQYSEPDTLIKQETPTEADVASLFLTPMGNAQKIASLACKGVGKIVGSSGEQCNQIKQLQNWDQDMQARLERTLRVTALEKARICAATAWEQEKASITDSYRRQAVRAGFDPLLVDVMFTDEAGNPTDETPDYTKDTLDSLKRQGILTDEKGIVTKTKDVPANCDYSAPYVPEYPGAAITAPVVPTQDTSPKSFVPEGAGR